MCAWHVYSRLFVKSDSAENGCELTEAIDVGTAFDGGGKGAANEGDGPKGLAADVGVIGVGRFASDGPAIVVMIGDAILDADDKGCGHEDGGGKPGILDG